MVFAPDLTTAELQALLAAHGLQIVEGPTGAGAFTLAPPAPAYAVASDTQAAEDAQRMRGSADTAVDQTLYNLRSNPKVLLAEPVYRRAPPNVD